MYKPRSGKVNASLKYYSDSQLKLIKYNTSKYLRRFGYFKTKDNPSGFISDDEDEPVYENPT